MDNDHESAQQITSWLSHVGYATAAAGGVEEALAALRQDTDLILLDVETAGYAVSAFLREMDQREVPVPVIALADCTDAAEAVFLLRAGVRDILQKPLRPADLVTAIQGLEQRLGKAPANCPITKGLPCPVTGGPPPGGDSAGQHDSMVQDVIDDALGGRLVVPQPSEVALRLLHLLREGRPGTQDVMRLIEPDQRLCGAVIHAANTARYAGRGRVATLSRAVTRLGNAEVARIAHFVLQQAAFGVASRSATVALDMVWDHSLIAGWALRDYVEVTRRGSNGVSYLAGLFHNIGFAVLISGCDAAVLRDGRELPSAPALLETLRPHARSVGIACLESWDLPSSIVAPLRSRPGAGGPAGDMLHALCCIDAESSGDVTACPFEHSEDSRAAAAVLGFVASEGDAFLEKIRRNVRDYRETLGVFARLNSSPSRPRAYA